MGPQVPHGATGVSVVVSVPSRKTSTCAPTGQPSVLGTVSLPAGDRVVFKGARPHATWMPSAAGSSSVPANQAGVTLAARKACDDALVCSRSNLTVPGTSSVTPAEVFPPRASSEPCAGRGATVSLVIVKLGPTPRRPAANGVQAGSSNTFNAG